MSEPFRIASCNLQTGIGTTLGYWHYLATAWKYVLPHGSAPVRRAATFLAEDVDLAAFCEVEGGSWRTKGVDQVALLAETTPLTHHVFFPTFTRGPHINQGNAFCARFPLHGAKQHALPGGGEPRFLCEAQMCLGETPVRVFVTHLSLYRALRARQLRRVADRVMQCDEPTILTGDFNATDDSELHVLRNGRLQQTDAGVTFPSWAPSRTLDHIFFSRHFEIIRSYTFDRFLFSDHLPLVADIRFA